MTTPIQPYSRSKATAAGSLAGMAVGVCAVIAFFTIVAGESPAFQSNGLTGFSFVMLALPGSLILGALIAFPTVAAMVFSVTMIARRVPIFDRFWVWTLAGALFASPTAYFFALFDDPDRRFSLVSIGSFFLAVGAIAGLVAWKFRHRTEPQA